MLAQYIWVKIQDLLMLTMKSGSTFPEDKAAIGNNVDKGSIVLDSLIRLGGINSYVKK